MTWREAQPDLPSGWAWTTIGEVADVELGKMLDRKKQTGEHAMPYLRNINVRWHSVDLDDLLTMDIAPETHERYSVRAGDLLVCEGGEPGRCAVVPEPAEGLAFQKALHRVRPAEGVDVRYLAYALEAMATLGHMAEHFTGSTIKHLPRERLIDLPIPLPPSREQLSIVAVLDEQMSAIERAMADLGVLQSKVRRLSDAVLNDVLKRASMAVSEPTLTGSVCDISGGIQKQPKRRPTSADPGVPFLRVANVGRRTLNLADVHRIRVSDVERDRVLLQAGDLLVVEGNGSPDQIGRAARWNGALTPCTHQNHLIRVRCSKAVMPEFLELVWNAPTTATVLRDVASTTSGLYTLSTKKIASVPLYIPALTVQAELVVQAQAQLDLAQRTTSGLEALHTRLGAMRPATLSRAFAGEMAERHIDDEPAELLLKRIREDSLHRQRAERARSRTVRKTRTTPPPKIEETTA